MKQWAFLDGDVYQADAFELEIQDRFRLIICDPPYGKITKEAWDLADYSSWMQRCMSIAAPDATICMWGGIGKAGDRPFLQFAAEVERLSGWEMRSWITWNKKRAYGVQDNYLFTREECLILTRGSPPFHVPLLEQKRGYAGFNKDYPAKSEFLRRTNVWTDITELFRGKIHPTQKPDALYRVLIETHSDPGDTVADLTGGSLVTARAARACGRRFFVVERQEDYLDAALPTLAAPSCEAWDE